MSSLLKNTEIFWQNKAHSIYLGREYSFPMTCTGIHYDLRIGVLYSQANRHISLSFPSTVQSGSAGMGLVLRLAQ